MKSAFHEPNPPLARPILRLIFFDEVVVQELSRRFKCNGRAMERGQGAAQCRREDGVTAAVTFLYKEKQMA